MNGFIYKFLMAAGVLLASGQALAESHGYINYMRSGTQSTVFVQQTVEGEYGTYVTSGDAQGSKEFWKGYGIGTQFGLELMKFVQFNASHTFVNMRSKADSLESLAGSRLNAGIRFAFLSPIGNLEAGGGVQGSRLDYQKQLENGSFYGSGFYYSIGVNYFLSSRISLTGEMKMTREHLDRSTGSAVVRGIDTNSTLMGAGFRIWL